MTQLALRTAVSDTYPNPTNAVARAGFGVLWDVANENTQAVELTLASAATTNIGGQLSTKLQITGTTTITSLGTTYRGPIFLRFASALTLTHNATTLILPKGANITVLAGDTCTFIPKATSGTADGWICTSYPSSWTGANGATGGGTDAIFYENGRTMNSNYTLSTNKNASMVGPLTVSSGISLTIPSGARLVVL